jgi:hypothetical protein
VPFKGRLLGNGFVGMKSSSETVVTQNHGHVAEMFGILSV